MVRLGSLSCAVVALLLAIPEPAAAEQPDIVWRVENPFRFWRQPEMFERHAQVYDAIVAENGGTAPSDIILQMEHRLNAVTCADRSTPDRCFETAPDRQLFEIQQAGWAAQSIDQEDVCYDLKGLRYPSRCIRTRAGKSFEEDYVLPAGHTVRLGLNDEAKTRLGSQRCVWTWRPRADIGVPEEMRTLRCSEELVIERVPYDPVTMRSGLSVDVTLPDGSAVFQEVVVRDLLVVGLGDSFASGEGNPDRPVRLSAWRSMRYASECGQSMSQTTQRAAPGFGQIPKRLLPDDKLTSGENISLCAAEGRKTFLANGPTWLSADCHRSQYSYQFRAALTLALENRHRAVTFVHLACTGAEATAGLFLEKEAREGYETNRRAKVASQFKQLTDLLCIDRRRTKAQYKAPRFNYGDAAVRSSTIRASWCPPEARKRAIDLVLLSIGGNDVGFSSLAAYGITDEAADLGPIVKWVGSEIRFSPKVARYYLEALDERMAAVKAALLEGFGVTPDRVVQTSYEPIQFDENNRPDDGAPKSICGLNPTIGMDVHPGLKFSRKRLGEVDVFMQRFFERLECISGRRWHRSCPASLATGQGTGFSLVTEHQPAFMNRGVCARDPARLQAETIEMTMPRRDGPKSFEPYNPSLFLPYVSRWRLFRTANDAYLIANTHAECSDLMCPHLDDFLQVAFAALYGGAIHPTAEGHALIADYAHAAAKKILERTVAIETLDWTEPLDPAPQQAQEPTGPLLDSADVGVDQGKVTGAPVGNPADLGVAPEPGDAAPIQLVPPPAGNGFEPQAPQPPGVTPPPAWGVPGAQPR